MYMSASLETIQNNTKILKEDLTQRLNNSTKINELFKKEPIKQSRKHYNSRMTGFESLQNEYKSFDSELDASIKQLNECKDLVANINKNGEQLIAILNDKKVATLKIQVQDEINNNRGVIVINTPNIIQTKNSIFQNCTEPTFGPLFNLSTSTYIDEGSKFLNLRGSDVS